ncbi:MAG: cell division ATPase MinD [Nanoarchaeota archaeon]|nr:cell division ATPase MinD [Nanoarchaeota archaeon]MBU0962286.1 cell division ATPase MinD [Nanoarchaeota archaeon]
MTYIISICSGKGGVGKTNVVINLGMALKNLGKDVTLLDANLTAPNLGLNLGFSKIPITLNDALKGRNHITEAVYIHSSGIKVLPASIALKDLSDVYPEKLKEAYSDLKKNSELVIVDNAPGLGREVVNSIKNSDEILVVTNPDLASVTDALRTVKLAKNLKIPIRGIVLTRFNESKYELSISEVESIIGEKIISIIPEDDFVKSSIKQKSSVITLYPKSKSSLAYKKLASDILGMKFNEEYKEDITNIHKLLRFFGFRK